MKRRILSLTLAAVLLLAFLPTAAHAAGTAPFSDVSMDAWYTEPILWATEAGITEGMGDGTFGVNGICNRAQMVTFLWRWFGCPEPNICEIPFADVPENQWYTKAVLWAAEHGITVGMGNGLFGLELPCSRAQVVTFLYRILNEPEVAVTECPFCDIPEAVSDIWYRFPVLWAVENGITVGMGDGTFGVEESCSRAQMVTFLYRTQNCDYVFKRAVAYYAALYINAEREIPCEILPGMSQVAQYRALQLTTNYSHSTADKREALARYEYGRYIDATEFGDDASNSYWEADTREAICAGFRGVDAEAMGKRIAELCRNSSNHWSYVGSNDYRYLGIGVEYLEGSEYGWYGCVMVGEVNYG